jgi:hypothetical protein
MRADVARLRAALEEAQRDGLLKEGLRFAKLALLDALVIDTVFSMAAGEHGIPSWLREAEKVLDERKARAKEQQ